MTDIFEDNSRDDKSFELYTEEKEKTQVSLEDSHSKKILKMAKENE